MIVESLTFNTVTNKKEKRSSGTSTDTILSFFQWCPLLPPPITVATAVDINHPEAPPTKRLVTTTTPSQSTYSLLGPVLLILTCTSKWLSINIFMPVTDEKYFLKDMLLAYLSFTKAQWLIKPFMSFLPVFQILNFSPPNTRVRQFHISPHNKALSQKQQHCHSVQARVPKLLHPLSSAPSTF